jgi:hypothetical protein
MKWKRVPKENSKQPASGTYSDWKEILAHEGSHQCVYCAIPEPRFGGIRNFHVEHYRPKGIRRFRKLTNDISNLYFACAICNTFKGDDWPSEPDPTFCTHCFPDPSITDYSDIFTSRDDGQVEGRYAASQYLTEKLFLNRPQLIYERRYASLVGRLKAATEDIAPIIDQLTKLAIQEKEALNCLGELCMAQTVINQAFVKMHNTPSYTTGDISRP